LFPDTELQFPNTKYKGRRAKRLRSKRKGVGSSSHHRLAKKRVILSSGDYRSSASDGSDVESAALADEQQKNPNRGRVKSENLYSRRRVVENLKGEAKKKVHFQLNKRWSVFSDEAMAHRGLEEKFDVITICRLPILDGKVVTASETAHMKNPPKPYKMSFPTSQSEFIEYHTYIFI